MVMSITVSVSSVSPSSKLPNPRVLVGAPPNWQLTPEEKVVLRDTPELCRSRMVITSSTQHYVSEIHS